MRLSHIHKIYHNKNNVIHALNDINLTIAPKGITYIVGPSGCGKTTLLNIISGKDSNYDGQVINCGLVESVEQNLNLIEDMSVLNNLLLVIDDKDKIIDMLKHFDLNEFINTKVKKLSVGQKKRIQIIRSLLVDCDYLICDEPTSSLDYENSHFVMKLLQEVSHNKGVIIVTHELALLDEYPGNVVHMGKGIIEDSYNDIQDEHKIIKKDIPLHNMKKHFSLIMKMIKTRYVTLFIKTLFILLIGCFVFVSVSLFPSLDSMIRQNQKWQTHENLIITQSRDHQMSSKKGDLYDNKDIQLVKDNVNGVIGYQFGWYASQLDHQAIFQPDMYIDDIRDALATMKPEDKEKEFYKKCRYIMEHDVIPLEKETGKPFPKDIFLYFDYRNLDNTFQGKYKTDIFDNLSIFNHNFIVQFYQLFDGHKIDLLTGRMMENEHEIVISQDLAKELCKAKGLENMEQLIGMEEELDIDINPLPKFQIVGIAYAENPDEHMIFLKEGTIEKLLTEYKIIKKETAKYLYVYFITDVKENEKEISEEINQTLTTKESEFVTYPESILADETQKGNHQTLYFYLFVFGGLLALTGIYVTMLFFDRKRYRKETYLFKHYGYKPLIIYGAIIGLSLIIVFGLQMIFSTILYDMFNTLATQFHYPLLSSNEILPYLMTFFVTAGLIITIEGIYYATTTSKHS